MQINRTTYTSSQPQLTLSFLPVEFEGGEDISAGTLDFESPEKLAELRQKHSETHIFYRSGSNVLCIPIKENTEMIGVACTLSLQDSRIAERLISATLARHFQSKSYLITYYKPLTLIDTSKNLLSECVMADQQGKIKGLAIYPKYELDARSVFPRDQKPVTGIAIDISSAYQIQPTASELMARGIGIIGRYVVKTDKFKGKLLGKVESVSGGKAHLSDYSGSAEVDLQECRLEANRENYSYCMQYLLGNAYPSIQAKLDNVLYGLLGGPGVLSSLQRIQKHLSELGSLQCSAGLYFKVGNLFSPATNQAVPHRWLQRPDFIFDPTGSKTERWHDSGLNQFGPFDAEFFTPKEPKVVVITPADLQGQAELFAKQLRDGIVNSKNFQKGLVRKYHLNDCKITIHPFQRAQNLSKAYREACIQALQNHYDLALVIIEERFHELHGEDNPYLVSKAVCMNNGVAVQEVEIETIKTSPYQLQYIMNNIALACYCKLGGIPYAITAAPVVAQELVIGLGSAIIRRQRLQGSERVVGITTIFNADGTYLLSNTSKEADYDTYIDELLSSLRSCIEDIKKRNAWQDGDQVRLVFHVFKPLKDLEAIAIKRFVEEIADKYQVEFAFLTFTRDHPFTILDRNQVGVDEWGKKKGSLVPERGFAINMSGNQALLTLTGPRQLKTATQGCPKPIILKLHKESTFRDLGYLTHQAYKFTFLSWRSFFPTMSPVTIEYSQLIARMLGELKGVSNWNPEILQTRLRTSRWFL